MTRWALVVALLGIVAIVAWLALRDGSDERAVVAPATTTRVTEPAVAERPSPLDGAHARADETQASATKASAIATKPSEPDAAPPRAPRFTLYGFVRPAVGNSKLHERPFLRVVDRLGHAEITKANADGAYSLSGLAPGTYWINGGSARDGSARTRVELGPDTSERRLDLQLELPPEVLVKVADRSGKPFATPGMLAVATREPSGDWFEEVGPGFYNTFGVGRFEHNEAGGARLGAGYFGKVVLDVPPPVFISLVVCQRVITTQRVELGTREIAFTLDRDSPLLQAGSVRFRLVDESGANIACNAVSFEGVFALLPKADGDGVFHLTEVPPGWYEIVVDASGFERAHRRVLVEPHIDNDFGSLTLDRERTLDALVVDESGDRTAARFLLDRVDPTTGKSVRALSHFAFHSDESGKLHVDGLSHAVYELRHSEPASPFGWLTRRVDLRDGSAELRIELARAGTLVVQPSRDVSRMARYAVFDRAGATVLSQGAPATPERIPLAPGDYEIEVSTTDAAPTRSTVTIGTEPVEFALP